MGGLTMFRSVADSPSEPTTEYPTEYPYRPQEPVFPLPSEQPDRWQMPVRFPSLAIVLGMIFAIGNFAAMPVMYLIDRSTSFGDEITGIWLVIIASAMFAQAGLLCCALVFCPAAFWRRTVGCWSIAINLWGCWAAGLALYLFLESGRDFLLESEFTQAVQFIGLSIPLLTLAIQSPLWFFRGFLGWRLERSETSEAPTRPLSISDYFIGTFIAAVSITLARLAPQPDWVDVDYWQRWGIVFSTVAVISLVSVIPTLLLICRIRLLWLALGILPAYGLILGIVAVSIVVAYDPPASWSANEIKAMLAFVMCFAGTTFLLGIGITALREMGFELVLGREARSVGENNFATSNGSVSNSEH